MNLSTGELVGELSSAELTAVANWVPGAIVATFAVQ